MTGRFGKPDATGRSSGIRAGRRGEAHRPPKSEPWVWLTRDLLASDAWKALSINGRRLIDFLLIEDMNHAGTENGNLAAPYNGLQEYGLSRRLIRSAIVEAVRLGLIRITKTSRRIAGRNDMARYRLTFRADNSGNPPTNDWKRYRAPKKHNARFTMVNRHPPPTVHEGEPPEQTIPAETGPSSPCDAVHHREHPSRVWSTAAPPGIQRGRRNTR